MSDVDDIIARLKERVPDLGGRVAGAAEFATLTATGAAPQVTPAAHVIPTGINGGAHLAQTGAFVQTLDRLYSVILTLRAADASGARALNKGSDFIDAVIAALAGWALGDRLGVIIFKRCTLVRAAGGIIAYELSFSLTDKLRTIPS